MPLQENQGFKSGNEYAGVWPRLVADSIDSCILDGISIGFAALALGVSYGIQKAAGGGADLTFMTAINPFFLQLFLGFCRLGLSVIYYTWATYKFQTTIGKQLFKVYVFSAKGDLDKGFEAPSFRQSLVRCLAYSVSYLTAGAGFSMILFHPEKKGLHDLIAGTVSIRKSKV